MEQGNTADLLKLVEDKRQCLEQSLRLTELMLEVLSSEEPERVDALLTERQQQFDQIEELNRAYDLLYIQIREYLSPEGFTLLKTKDTESLALTREIQTVDRAVSDKMRTLLIELRQQIHEVNLGRKGLAAYGEQQREAQLVDKKSD